jgi:hypothetical protein
MRPTGTESRYLKLYFYDKMWGGIYVCCLLTLILCASIASAQRSKADLDLKDLLGQLETQHGPTKSLAAQFRQEKHFSFMSKPIISEGFIIFAAPDKIRFDITDPFQTALLDDGKRIQRHEIIDGQWKPLQFGGGKSIKLVMRQIGQWMQGKFSGQEEIFTLSMSAGDPDDYAVLNLVPRHKQFRQYIEKIQVHIAPAPTYRVTRIDIKEPQGDSFALIFSREQKNKNLPKGCFSNPETATQCIELFKDGEESKKRSERKGDAECHAGG